MFMFRVLKLKYFKWVFTEKKTFSIHWTQIHIICKSLNNTEIEEVRVESLEVNYKLKEEFASRATLFLSDFSVLKNKISSSKTQGRAKNATADGLIYQPISL